ncbi:sam domain-containing protein [Lichtheimia corymbifera JMRC:FSU:9682]|uniref:Kinesin-like protein n=1 Tax=Lichtheimia corymbifera JMRC:FSU:9682 TaxID=1263082 RepID=A0A068S7Z4_9FUNG|nr:sam domain-containing protein [Lichtheimia corymbifera JMRC:FSU:9682]
MSTLNVLAELSMQDCTRLGVRSIDDKRRFMALADDVKRQLQSKATVSQHTPIKRSSATTPPHTSTARKRQHVIPPSEKQARRMTIAPQTVQRANITRTGIPSSITAVNSNASSTTTTTTTTNARNNRRLSYLPRQHRSPIRQPQHRSPIRKPNTASSSSAHSPIRKSTTTATTAAAAAAAAAASLPHSPIRRPITSSPGSSPLRPTTNSKTPPKMPKFMEESGVEVKPAEEPVQVQKQPTRYLDAYGIPVNAPPRQRRLSNDGLSGSSPATGTSIMSFEEYIRARANKTTIQASSGANNGNSDLHQRIRVCVRKRPLSKKEINHGEMDVAPVVSARTIQINAPRTRVDLTRFTEQHSFTFDDVFDSSTTNIDIYRRTAYPLVEYMFGGGKATCFAYGQTGSGKTYTMLDPKHGLYVQAAHDIFHMLGKPQYSHLSAWVGFYEIYQGQLYDLLNQRKRLTPREDGNSNVVIAGLKEFPIKDVDRLMEVFDFGSQARTTGKTGANNNSSRSHAVLQVLLKSKGDNTAIHGKLSFIDLAGSERGADRGEANPKTRMEGAEINKSLLALKECIRALDQDKRHTPFRGSKLTQVLRDSFVGDSRTCMIATISPNNPNSEHTLNTLRYADRVKELKGESDPRLLAEAKTESQDLMPQDDIASNANSDALWDDDQTENLLDIDFPSQMSSTALETPKSHHPAAGSGGDSDMPDRQRHMMRRLSSPPAEDPPQKHEPQPMELQQEEEDTSSKEVSVQQIRDFISLHRAQIKELDTCIQREKRMVSNLSLAVSSHYDCSENNGPEESKESHEKTVSLYQSYLKDLDDVLDEKYHYVEALREKVKREMRIMPDSI